MALLIHKVLGVNPSMVTSQLALVFLGVISGGSGGTGCLCAEWGIVMGVTSYVYTAVLDICL